MNLFARSLISLICLAVAGSVSAHDGIDGAWGWNPENVQSHSRPPMWDQVMDSAFDPRVSLAPASRSAPNKLDALRSWNMSRRTPVMEGISHELGDPARILIDPNIGFLESGQGAKGLHSTWQTANGEWMWSETFRVEKSHRLRLKLENVQLPENAKLWVIGPADDLVGPFGADLSDPDGNLWTPSVAGPEITLVMLVSPDADAAGFVVTDIMEFFKLGSAGQPLVSGSAPEDDSCKVDSTCFGTESFSAIRETEASVARISYVRDGSGFQCSGGLINDTVDSSTIPYFLTANHCISTQAEASSLEAVWDYRPATCDGQPPSISSLPRSSGATLLVTGEEADFTMLRLNTVPSGRWYMGYSPNSSSVPVGTTLHRVSHPNGDVAHYGRSVVNGGSTFCTGWPRESWIYQDQTAGVSTNGSSGSPVLLDNGRIVGVLSGRCGDNYEDDCDYGNLTVDGALSTFWPSVRPFLVPDTADPADLALTSVDAADGSFGPGDSFIVNNRIQNIGGSDAPAYRITFYASTNSTITTSDYSFGFVDREALAPSEGHNYNTTVTVPSSIPAGNYFVGAILDVSDANAANNTAYDPAPIAITSSSSFQINPGLNGAWFDPATSGQGFFIDVLPDSGIVFLSWFTFDTARPPDSYLANLGEPGHRWLTGQGGYSGNTAQLDLFVSSGGVFDQGSPSPANTQTGTMTIEFIDCNRATITYNIPGVGSGVIQVQRVASDNVGLCESINDGARAMSPAESELLDQPVE